MQKQFDTIMKCLVVLVILVSVTSCKKEHLQPDTPVGTAAPFVYITAKLNNDSLYFAGGVNSYVGSTAINDTLTNRIFFFALKNPQNAHHSYFQISINNYKNVLGVAQNDLDSSIYAGTRHYQDTIHFMPLAVTVEWFDSTGVKYSSEFLQQAHLFSIQSVDNISFENKNYKKAIADFNCNLSDGHGHILHLTNGKATLLFGAN